MKLTPDEKLVVTLDVCFSSSIVGFLSDKSTIQPWEKLLGWLKWFVWRRIGKPYCYKFIGDGWILLLPSNSDAAWLLAKLKKLSDGFNLKYEELIEPQYSTLGVPPPPYSGLTFGVDSGVLLRTRMINKREYLGPALNIASRLQGKAKELHSNDAGGCLVASDCAYQKHLKTVSGYNWKQEETSLRNIKDGQQLQVWTCKL